MEDMPTIEPPQRFRRTLCISDSALRRRGCHRSRYGYCARWLRVVLQTDGTLRLVLLDAKQGMWHALEGVLPSAIAMRPLLRTIVGRSGSQRTPETMEASNRS